MPFLYKLLLYYNIKLELIKTPTTANGYRQNPPKESRQIFSHVSFVPMSFATSGPQDIKSSNALFPKSN